MCYTTDDTKLEQLVRCAKENAGTVYCLVGIHSDNIKRANDRCALRTSPSPTHTQHLAPSQSQPEPQSTGPGGEEDCTRPRRFGLALKGRTYHARRMVCGA